MCSLVRRKRCSSGERASSAACEGAGQECWLGAGRTGDEGARVEERG